MRIDFRKMLKCSVRNLAAIFFIVPFFFVSCCDSYLSVYSDYVTEKTLASYHVNTPDPRQLCPEIGQRLIVTWIIPKYCEHLNNLHLIVEIKFKNITEIREFVPITSLSGTYIYNLVNQDYAETGGILTYQVFLMNDATVLQHWRHIMWVDFIYIQPQEAETPATPGEEQIRDAEFIIPPPENRQ